MSREKDFKDAGYQRSTQDSQKFINTSNGHWGKIHEGGSVTVSTSRHNTYGKDMSGNAFADRLKK